VTGKPSGPARTIAKGRWAPTLAAAAFVAAGCLAAVAPAAAVTCHCFRDREYDPAKPAKSDVYLLATAGNSFLAAAYGIPKGDIVRALMSGTAGSDVWISTYAGSRLRMGPTELLGARARAPSWREVLGVVAGSPGRLGERFGAALTAGAGEVDLARIAAAETLAARAGTPWSELDALAGRGATLQETVLAVFLGRWSKRPPTAVFDDAKGGRKSWSALLYGAGLVPKAVEEEIARSLR
jgi:hypothetical protein